jgi:hypothetical protein
MANDKHTLDTLYPVGMGASTYLMRGLDKQALIVIADRYHIDIERFFPFVEYYESKMLQAQNKMLAKNKL